MRSEKRAIVDPSAIVGTLADELNQSLCAITVNADAITRLLDAPQPDLHEIRAAAADIASDADRVSKALHAAQRLLERSIEPASVVNVIQLLTNLVAKT